MRLGSISIPVLISAAALAFAPEYVLFWTGAFTPAPVAEFILPLAASMGFGAVFARQARLAHAGLALVVYVVAVGIALNWILPAVRGA